MEFNEKLQQLRKSKGLTQEELAQALYVSRTAVSKWESGRGYPSIDSLKDISAYFSVTIDDLLSGEKLIRIAEVENRGNIRRICDLLYALADLLSLALILLPLYPRTVEGYVYSVTLRQYTQTAVYNLRLYWVMFLGMAACGVLELLPWKNRKPLTRFSLALSVATVLYLVVAREAYAAVVALLLMLGKGVLVFQTDRR
jgi:transcriptional regulator with XRE-family HTH domain